MSKLIQVAIQNPTLTILFILGVALGIVWTFQYFSIKIGK